VFLSRNLDQNKRMLKNGLFFRKKKYKNGRSVWASTPKPPLASGDWGSVPDLELLFSYIIAT